jgi:hypothetical protein
LLSRRSLSRAETSQPRAAAADGARMQKTWLAILSAMALTAACMDPDGEARAIQSASTPGSGFTCAETYDCLQASSIAIWVNACTEAAAPDALRMLNALTFCALKSGCVDDDGCVAETCSVQLDACFE